LVSKYAGEVELYVAEGFFDENTMAFTPRPEGMMFGVGLQALTGQAQVHEY
jgi:hypothetical protein